MTNKRFRDARSPNTHTFRIDLILLLALLVPSLHPAPINQASISHEMSASLVWSVTSDTNFYNVTNDYFKVSIRKDTLNNHRNYGGIESIWLKPSDTQIVSSSISAFGGSEYKVNGSTSFYHQFDEIAGHTQPISLSLVASTSNYAVVQAFFGLGPYEKDQLYYAFYSNQPYYLMSIERAINATTFASQRQSCFGLDPSWSSSVTYLNATGGVSTINRPVSFSTDAGLLPFYKVSLKAQSYPWVYYYNSTNNEGVGIIFADLFPSSTTWGYSVFIAAKNEPWDNEVQINWSQINGGDDNYPDRVVPETYRTSVLVYATSNSTSVSNLAKALWTSTYEQEQASGEGVSGYLTTGKGIQNGLGIILYPWSNYMNWWPTVERSTKTSYFDAAYGNATVIWPTGLGIGAKGTYVSSYQANDGTYANLTKQIILEKQLKVNMTFHLYNDSDKMKVNVGFYILTGMHLRELGIWFGGGPSGGRTASLGSGVYEQYWPGFAYANVGQLYHNFTGNVAAVETRGIHLYAEVVKNVGGDKYYVPANGTWSMSLYVQPWAKDKEFTASDAAGSLHTNAWQSFQNHYTRLFNTTNSFSTPFSVLDIFSPDTTLLYHDYSNNQLTLLTAPAAGISCITKLYVANQGPPSMVTGAESWDYDLSTKVVTINTSNSAPETVTILFAEGSGSTTSGGSTQLTILGLLRANPIWLFGAVGIILVFAVAAFVLHGRILRKK